MQHRVYLNMGVFFFHSWRHCDTRGGLPCCCWSQSFSFSLSHTYTHFQRVAFWMSVWGSVGLTICKRAHMAHRVEEHKGRLPVAQATVLARPSSSQAKVSFLHSSVGTDEVEITYWKHNTLCCIGSFYTDDYKIFFSKCSKKKKQQKNKQKRIAAKGNLVMWRLICRFVLWSLQLQTFHFMFQVVHVNLLCFSKGPGTVSMRL